MPTPELFSSEARILVEALTNGMLQLERHPSAVEQLDSCALAARALKIAARVAGFKVGADLADAMECCFHSARQYQVALHPEQVALIFKGVDLIERLASVPRSQAPSAAAPDDPEETDERPPEQPDQVIKDADLRASRRNKRVLVVDDSPAVRELGSKLLSFRGYEVQSAVDGVDAWYAVGKHHFDLVLTDIDMPLLNGIELTKLLRADARFERLPILVVCDKDGAMERWRAFDAGANYYVMRNRLHETLLPIVASLIGPALS